MISVCIVTGRRNDLLADCMASLASQEGAPTFEVLVCADADRDVEPTVRRHFPDATVLHVPKSLPSAGRNHLLEVASGEFLYFLDDDIAFGTGLLRRLGELIETHPDVGVFGGPNETPIGSSRFQWVQGAVLASLVASGPVRRRYGAHPAGEADERWFILCNLAIRRSVMRSFDERLVCAEENALLAELHDADVPMHYDPELTVFHERRGDLAGFLRQMHKYGRGRGQVVRRRPLSTSPAFVAPAALVTYLASTPALALLRPWTALPALLYAGVVAAGGAKVAWSLRRASTWPEAVLLILVVHLGYGSGLIRGVLGRRSSTPTSPERLAVTSGA